MRPRVFIFDFDGTIADTFPDAVDIFRKLLGDRVPEDFSWNIDIIRGLSTREIISQCHIRYWEIPFFLWRAKRLIGERIRLVKIQKDLRPVLETLVDRGIIIGIATSNSKDNVEVFLRENGLDMFSFVYTEKNIFGKDKMLKRLMRKNLFVSSECVYVGDELRDVEAANKAGICVAAVTWGFDSETILEKSGPDYLIRKPEELLGITRL